MVSLATPSTTTATTDVSTPTITVQPAVGAAAWIHAGGAHHTGFSLALTPEHLEDFAAMAGIEFLLIDHLQKNVVRSRPRGELDLIFFL